MDIKNKRTVILLGHAHSGKTSLSEAILFSLKATSRMGSVLEGNTVSDYSSDEVERKSSINSGILLCEAEGVRIQMIDAPGYLDFWGEVLSGVRAVDSAILVVDASDPVAVGTERAWEKLEELNIPRLIFVNKADKEGVDLAKVIGQIQSVLSTNAVAVNDLSEPALMDAAAECDDALLEKYLENGTLSPDEVKQALRKGVVNACVFPVFCGSALSGAGLRELVQAIIAYLPSPLERPEVFAYEAGEADKKVEIKPSESEPFSGFVFKTISDPYVGQLSLIRVFSGKLASNTSFYNVTHQVQERIGPVFFMQGKEQRAVSEAGPGDIIAIAKLKNTFTNDSVSDGKIKCEFPVIEFPPALISASVRPKTRQDEEKISIALSKLAIEDHTFKVSRDPQTKEEIVSGLGDVHLDVLMGRLKRRFHVEVEMGTPKVPYKETILRKVKVQGRYKKQSGGRGQYGDVWIEVEPLAHGKQYEFVDKIVGGAIPRNFIPSAEKGIKHAMEEGVLAGYPVVDIKVTLVDGSYHDVDSSDMAFQIAGSMALKKAVQEAMPILLEPIMNVEVIIPEEFMGLVSGDINSRRGRVMGMDAKGKSHVMKATVPLSEMFKYANDLRSMTGGRGYFTMEFSHYEQVPPKNAAAVITQSQAQRAHEAAEVGV